jgi:hypothetical protein
MKILKNTIIFRYTIIWRNYGTKEDCSEKITENTEAEIRERPQHPGNRDTDGHFKNRRQYLYRGFSQDRGEIFVAILGASEITYAEATESQQQEQFVRSVERAFRYFGGATNMGVPDSHHSRPYPGIPGIRPW